jgi:hypothetical protein
MTFNNKGCFQDKAKPLKVCTMCDVKILISFERINK